VGSSVTPLGAGAMSYLVLTLRSLLSMLSIRYLLGLVDMEVLVSEYQQGWLMPCLCTKRKGLPMSHKACHLIKSTGETFLLILSRLGKLN